MGCPSSIFFGIWFTLSPNSAITLAVPSVANNLQSAFAISSNKYFKSDLSLSATLKRTPLPRFKFNPEAIKAFDTADPNSKSTPITSPVDFISGPKYVSTPANLDIEKTGALTATNFWFSTNPLT